VAYGWERKFVFPGPLFTIGSDHLDDFVVGDDENILTGMAAPDFPEDPSGPLPKAAVLFHPFGLNDILKAVRPDYFAGKCGDFRWRSPGQNAVVPLDEFRFNMGIRNTQVSRDD
jgi:hypothetical protein